MCARKPGGTLMMTASST